MIGLHLLDFFSLRCWGVPLCKCIPCSAPWSRSEPLCSDLLAVGCNTRSGRREWEEEVRRKGGREEGGREEEVGGGREEKGGERRGEERGRRSKEGKGEAGGREEVEGEKRILQYSCF